MSDKELLHKYIANKDDKAFSELYKKYYHLVYLVCMKYLKDNAQAQDMTTDIFIKVMKEVFRFEIKNFKSRLMQVSRNACLMYLRDRKSISVEFEDKFIEPEEAKDFDKEEEEYDRLDYCMAQLSEEQKQCVQMFFKKGMKYQEIESETGFSFKNIKSYLQNAKRNLKNCMNKA